MDFFPGEAAYHQVADGYEYSTKYQISGVNGRAGQAAPRYH
jgi:hypothetical protein